MDEAVALSRRSLLKLGALGLAGGLAGCTRAQNPLIEPLPEVIRSDGGLLELTLPLAETRVELAGRPARLFAYGGRVPGPRLELRPGDTLRLRLENRLKEPTNLHFHGLHVSPSGNSDNVFLEIPPGEVLVYEVLIPKDHPAGTFWYHPHRHGLVARQVFAGAAGLLVVRGDLDEVPEVAAAREAFLVLKDFALAGERVPAPSPMERAAGREGPILTANGKTRERLSVPRGGLLRLRLLNASASRVFRLRLDEHPFYLIATDGGGLAEPVELEELLLAPGERAEVLVRGNRPPGSYALRVLPYDRGGPGGMGMGMGMGGFARPQSSGVVGELVYEGEARPELPLPTRLLSLDPLPAPVRTRRFLLGHAMRPGRGMVFVINGKTFDPRRVDVEARLGDVEEWELVNLGVMDHPFHLHTNPFQVVSRNGRKEPFLAWRDVVNLRPNERVRFRVRYQDFTGRAVFHCHILDHEDLGMMGVIEHREGARAQAEAEAHSQG